MEAVQRQAALDSAVSSLEEDSLLRGVIEEIEDLKARLPSRRYDPASRQVRIGDVLNERRQRRFLAALLEKGMPEELWHRLLQRKVPRLVKSDVAIWDDESWLAFLHQQAIEIAGPEAGDFAATGGTHLSRFPTRQSLREAVAENLPPQPWPKNIHKLIAAKLSLSHRQASQIINSLIREGRFLPQINGVVYYPREEGEQEE